MQGGRHRRSESGWWMGGRKGGREQGESGGATGGRDEAMMRGRVGAEVEEGGKVEEGNV